MFKIKAAVVIAASFLPFQLQAQTACEAYTVTSGDTLRLIAERVFGSRDLSPVIYNANRSIVGGNPNNIEIGMRLQIPCGALGGAVSIITDANAIVVETTELPHEPSTIPEPEEIIPAPAKSTDELPIPSGADFPEQPTFVSAFMFPPFSDGDGNGFMTDIVRAALGDAEYIDGVGLNPVSLPFDPLMASADPDVILSFPWINPGCKSTTFLSDRSRDLCENYQFSDKAYDIVMTFFVADRGGLAEATHPSDFAGKRICVPEQYPINHLGEAGFSAPNVFIERGNSVAECMSKLLSGQTDVVNADYLSIESTYSVLTGQSIIVENPSFTWIRSVHAIAKNDNIAGAQTLAAFNDGLKTLKDSGEFSTIERRYEN